MTPIKTLLIANRGEIACRIIKTAQRKGIHCVAVYSEADQQSLHVEMADSAYWIGHAPAQESYLVVEKIMAVARLAQVDAIHPGYGFLSENPALAKACQEADIIWVGPGEQALKAMASKQLAKQLLENTDVPLTPGYHGEDQDAQALLDAAKQIGFPVLLKAAAGGGGKGMRIVEQKADFNQALSSAKREAKASFDDDKMIIEKYISQPRHVEVQILADKHGHCLHLFERDCSIQRRHQKIIEEAPAPDLDEKTRHGLHQAAITVAKTIEYVNAGTIEFLVDESGKFYFMEMNTRLQVEHPVTEMVTGLDLVALQLDIACGMPLPFKQEDISVNGHAIECRIYAEDVSNQFLPSIGKITHFKPPVGRHTRIDSGITAGKNISQFYDPMVAKLITWGESRETAVLRMQHSLTNFAISGIKTNIAFCLAICQQPEFIQAKLSTHYLNQFPPCSPKIDERNCILLTACLAHNQAKLSQSNPIWQATFAFQQTGQSHWHIQRLIEDEIISIKLEPIEAFTIIVTWQNHVETITWQVDEDQITITHDNQTRHYHFFVTDSQESFWSQGGMGLVEHIESSYNLDQNHGNKSLTAPMPATVVAIHKQPGDTVKQGEAIIVLEAMKMEHAIEAPYDGVLESLCFELGAQVQEGAELVILSKQQEAHVER